METKSKAMYCVKTFLQLSLFSLLTIGIAVGQVTERPKVEDQSVKYVQITKVELTNQYTKIYLRFQSAPRAASPFLPRQNSSPERIWIDPETRLYKPGDINTKFRFIKAEGIPTNPEKRNVNGGETIDFVTYFERLSPGIEIFDFYEGRSGKEGQTWNFYGIHIANPLKKPAVSEKQNPKPESSAEIILEDKPEPDLTATEISPSIENTNISALKGTIYDSRTKQPIRASIFYLDKEDSLSLTTSSSGKYSIALSADQNYILDIKAKGYVAIKETISGVDVSGNSIQSKDFYLTPLTAGESFRLNNIYFETAKFTLLPESYPELDQLVETLQQNPSMQIRVEGHTDSAGDFDKNLLLSKNRAASVKEYLIKKGIQEDRIETQGYGATRPASQGKSEDQKQKNRRVEIVIIKT
jgi:OOP family OmpA-OmpF porin